MPASLPRSIADFWIRRMEVADSTQDQVFRMLRSATPPPSGTVVVARRQTRGRGREGRLWLSPEGGLYCSILLRPTSLDPALLLRLPLVAGLAVADLVSAAGGSPQIKWPNDVLVDGRKIAGVLCESRDGAVAIGIGVNLTEAPLDTATCLSALGMALPPEECLRRLLEALAERLGRSDTATAVNALLYGRGRRIRCEGGEGVIEDVDEEGSLLVRIGDRTVSVHSGEAIFL